MARSLRMRPSWVCLKLCYGDTIAATVLAEVLFRAAVTKYKNGYNPVIVFSHQEWADNIGCSLSQVRKALSRLSSLHLISKYNDSHPFKGVLRALHIEVPQSLQQLFHFLTHGEYVIEGDTLRLSLDGSSNIKLNVSDLQSTPDSAITESPSDIPLCPQGADVHIYNKNFNENSVSALQNAEHSEQCSLEKEKTEEKKEKEEKEETLEEEVSPSVLMNIPTLPKLINDLYIHYLEYHNQEKAVLDKPGFSAYDAAKIWKNAVVSSHSKYSLKALGGKDYKLLSLMVDEFEPDVLEKLIKSAVGIWPIFVTFVAEETYISFKPNVPDVGFLYKFRGYAYNRFIKSAYTASATQKLSEMMAKAPAKKYKQPVYKEKSEAELTKLFKF